MPVCTGVCVRVFLRQNKILLYGITILPKPPNNVYGQSRALKFFGLNRAIVEPSVVQIALLSLIGTVDDALADPAWAWDPPLNKVSACMQDALYEKSDMYQYQRCNT